LTQLSILKAEIKNKNQKIDELNNSESRVSDLEELKKSVNKVLENYKPKKKEHEEAVKKIKEYLSLNSEGQHDNNSANSDKKKGGFMGLFKKK
jgi:hypothetical protein